MNTLEQLEQRAKDQISLELTRTIKSWKHLNLQMESK